MASKSIPFRIRRYQPGVIDPSEFRRYAVSVGPRTTVLDALETIRREQDPTLLYRHSCHHSSCGTCACRVNGEERLACVTRVLDLDGEEVTVEPLQGFAVLADLVVDMRGFFRAFPPDGGTLRPSEACPEARPPEGVDRYERFENCIECGGCVSACPAAGAGKPFVGPAALAAVHREIEKNPARTAGLLPLADGEGGARGCERALRCSRVCPTEVYPARHIHALQQCLKGSKD